MTDLMMMDKLKVLEEENAKLKKEVESLKKDLKDTNGMLDICITKDLKNKYEKPSLRRMQHTIKLSLEKHKLKEENAKLRVEKETSIYEYADLRAEDRDQLVKFEKENAKLKTQLDAALKRIEEME